MSETSETDYDFYNPFMSVTLVDSAGVRTPLWTAAPGDNPLQSLYQSSDTQALPFVTSVEVEYQLAYVPRISITLTPPYEDAIAFLDSSLIEWSQTTVEVLLGYVLGPDKQVVLSPLLIGTILKPDIQLGMDVTITLHAQGVGSLTAARQGGTRTERKATRRKLIEDILSGEGLQNKRPYADINFDDVDKLGTAEVIHKMNEEPRSYTQGSQTDWLAANQLATEAKCWIRQYENKIIVSPMNALLSAPPKRALRLYSILNGRLGPKDNAFPILSASSPTMAVYLPGAVRGFFLQGINSFDRKPITKTIDDNTEAGARTNKGTAIPPATTQTPGANDLTGQGKEFFPGDPSDGSSAAMEAQGEWDLMSTAGMGIKLNIETIGIPDLTPGDVVSVEGLGVRMSHNYLVYKLTHVWGATGTNTSLELGSNASLFQLGLDPKGTPNTAEAPSPEDQNNINVTPKAQN